MEAIVLAGGLGTRLRETVPNLPKPMAPVGGRPFLEIVLIRLAEQGFLRVVLSVGYLAEKIVAHFGDRFSGMDLIYAREQFPLGTGGAVRLALTQCENEHSFVFNGDTYLDLEVDRVEAQWQARRRPIIVARSVADAARYGRLEVHKGSLQGFSATPRSGPGIINAGCYVLPVNALNAYQVGEVFSFEKDYLAAESRRGTVDWFLTQGRFIDIGVPEDYHRAQQELARIAL